MGLFNKNGKEEKYMIEVRLDDYGEPIILFNHLPRDEAGKEYDTLILTYHNGNETTIETTDIDNNSVTIIKSHITAIIMRKEI